MKILPAPIYSFFSKDFYRLAVAERLGTGFKYLAYLVGLSTVLLWITIVVHLFPAMNSMADWLRDETPSMTWTPDGLVLNARNPYQMMHPQYGPVAIFDMTLQEVTAADMGEALIFVTRKAFFMRDPGSNQLRAYDIAMPQNSSDPAAAEMIQQIDGEAVYQFVMNSKTNVFVFGSLLFFPLFFIWKLVQVLVFSGIGYLINMTLKESLPYEKIFLLGCFIVTPITLIELRAFIYPALLNLPFGWIGGFIVAAIYYFIALKACEADLLQKPSEEV